MQALTKTTFEKKSMRLIVSFRETMILTTNFLVFFFTSFFIFYKVNKKFEVIKFYNKKLIKKEMFQPNLPVRLPCYEFTPQLLFLP